MLWARGAQDGSHHIRGISSGDPSEVPQVDIHLDTYRDIDILDAREL